MAITTAPDSVYRESELQHQCMQSQTYHIQTSLLCTGLQDFFDASDESLSEIASCISMHQLNTLKFKNLLNIKYERLSTYTYWIKYGYMYVINVQYHCKAS